MKAEALDVTSDSPLFFGTDATGPLFGCWSPGTGDLRDVGVVLCSPFGREEVSAHRTIRQLALRLAGTGLATLRFDWPCSGNSGGADPDAELASMWVRSIHAAADELKRRSGASRVCFIGLRLGALLALRAASERADVAAIGALVPVTSGRAFVRELRALGAAASAPAPRAGVADAGDAGGGGAGSGLESGGFTISEATCTALSAMNEQAPTRAPALQMLVIERDDMPSQSKWLAHLAGLGARTEHHRLAGYAELMLDPHRSVVPVGMIDATVAVLRDGSFCRNETRNLRCPTTAPRRLGKGQGAGDFPVSHPLSAWSVWS